MQDKQNKGIGQYKDRPGYFMGGMIGGAILGALVNKIQGKDVGRGALWGGITGGLGQWAGSAMMPAGGQTAASIGKMPWWKKMLYTAGQKFGKDAPALIGTGAGLTGAWMAGDPKKDRSDYEDWVEEQEAKRREKQNAAYKYWHWNPWATGGIVSARKGFYNGGGAWSDVAGEEDRSEESYVLIQLFTAPTKKLPQPSDHDSLISFLGKSKGTVNAAIIELNALPYPVGPAAQDDDLLFICHIRLVLFLIG